MTTEQLREFFKEMLGEPDDKYYDDDREGNYLWYRCRQTKGEHTDTMERLTIKRCESVMYGPYTISVVYTVDPVWVGPVECRHTTLYYMSEQGATDAYMKAHFWLNPKNEVAVEMRKELLKLENGLKHKPMNTVIEFAK